MSESTELQPIRGSTAALVHKSPVRFTRSFKLASNGATTSAAFLLCLPVIFLAAIGAPGTWMPLAGIPVVLLWSLSILDNASLLGNGRLRDEGYKEFRQRWPNLAAGCLGFVGVCRPGYLLHQMWHADIAHEDVGFLSLTSGSLEFRGDGLQISIPRGSIQRISSHTNPFYSWMGLHWIRIVYGDGPKPTYLYVQSRQKDRITQLVACNRMLLDRLQGWWGGSPALPARGTSTAAEAGG